MTEQVPSAGLPMMERVSVPPPASAFAFACPLCRTSLAAALPDEWRCPADGSCYRCVDGIWRFLRPEREAFFEQFIREYETVRRAEGRGARDAAYYRALPFEDRSGRFRDDWRIRARSFQALVARVLRPLEAQHRRPLKVLDLGTGNGWLAYRLAERGHHVAAVDLLTNAFDGLGAHVYYPAALTPVQAEFDHLPLEDSQVDLVLFNGSLHYSTGYETTLAEALRVLRPDGRLVIMDSPVYRDAASGAQMVREREAQFERTYGFPSNALPNENYLTYDRLDDLAARLGLHWQLSVPFYGWRWALRPWKARLRGRREPAKFVLIVGTRVSSARRPPAHSSLIRRLWRRLLQARFHLLQRHRYNRLVLEEVAGAPIVTLPQVFNPKLFRSGEFLARCLGADVIAPVAAVLDMGTGSGVGAVFAARWAARVVAVDINPEAVRCARINALLNRVEERVEVRQGDLFAPVAGERFDLVLFNPPYYPGQPADALDWAWRSDDVPERFAAGLPAALATGGRALVVLSSDADEARWIGACRENGLTTRVLRQRDLINEMITVYEVRRGDDSPL